MHIYTPLSHVSRVKSGGKTYYYYLKPGQKTRIRLPDPNAGPELCLREYAKAEKAGNEQIAMLSNSGANRYLVPLLHEYLNHIKDNLKPGSRKQYRYFIKVIGRRFRGVRLREVTYENVLEFQNAFKGKVSATHTIRFLKSAFRWFVQQRYISYSPIAEIPSPNVDYRGFEEWTTAEINQFRDMYAPGSWPRQTFEKFLFLGCRISDAVHLRRRDISQGELTYIAKKTNTWITLDVSGRWDLFEDLKRNDPIFMHPRTRRRFKDTDQLRYEFTKCTKKAGVKKTIHGIRRTAAIAAAEKGLSANELMARYGWLSINTAQTYVGRADRKMLGLQGSKKLR